MSPGIELGTSRTQGRALTNCATLAPAEENLELELEIVKAEARDKALDEINKEQVPLLYQVVQSHYYIKWYSPTMYGCIFSPNCGAIVTSVIAR